MSIASSGQKGKAAIGSDNDDEPELQQDTSDDTGIINSTSKSKKTYQVLVSKLDPSLRPVLFFPYPEFLEMTRNIPDGYQVQEIQVQTSGDQDFRITFGFTKRFMYNAIFSVFKSAKLIRINHATSSTKWNIFWGQHLTSEEYHALLPFQRVNHFPGSFELGRKDRLCANILKMQRKYPHVFQLIPETYLTGNDHEKQLFLQAFEKTPGTSSSTSKSTLWILKPPNLSCGRGIKIVAAPSLGKVKLTKNKAYVAQRYIANPLLINDRKFDMRIYVLVTSYDPLKIYLYDNGLVRFCTEKYTKSTSKDALKNVFSHLTNYSVNKKNTDFQKNQNEDEENTGSKWSLQALFAYLKSSGTSKETLELLMKHIEDLIIKTFICVEAKLLAKFTSTKPNGFELYGFDVLLDENMHPWLLEVNVFPSIGSSSPMDKKIKTILIADIFQLIGVPVMDAKDEAKVLDKKKTERLMGLKRTNSNGSTNKLCTTGVNIGSVTVKKRKTVDELIHGGIKGLDENDLQIVKEMEEEEMRKGHFKRIFPSATSFDYLQYFETQRYNNILCSMWLQKIGGKKRPKNSSSIKQTPSTCSSTTIENVDTRDGRS